MADDEDGLETVLTGARIVADVGLRGAGMISTSTVYLLRFLMVVKGIFVKEAAVEMVHGVVVWMRTVVG